jgi:dTDP-4-amino-4,6-dideoxygalactose transaminase
MRSTLLPFSPPAITEEEIEAVTRVLRSGWPTTGPEVRGFEQEFIAKFDCEAALPLSSGTAALHLGLLAVGVRSGDAVITTPLTFASTAHAIEYCGALPVFVDVDESLNISPMAIEQALKQHDNVRAILPVHLHGNPADLAAIDALARKHSVAVVEDAAHAVGAKAAGRYIGNTRDCAVPSAVCFSFYATKNVTTIEGGMLAGKSDVVERARKLSFLGIDRSAWQRADAKQSWRYDVTSAGFKYNLSDVAAAIGRVQLARFDAMQARRRAIAERYLAELSSIPELELPAETPDTTHAWHLFVIRLRTQRFKWSADEAQSSFIAALREKNISASVHFTPLHQMSYFREKYSLHDDDLPVTAREAQRIVSLPLHPMLSDEHLVDVIDAVKQVVTENRR